MRQETKHDGASLSQRGLWTFLFFTLAGPMFGAIAGILLVQAARMSGVDMGDGADAAASRLASDPGSFAIIAFTWSAVPATLAGLLALGVVLWRGRLGAAEAGMTGVLGFALAILIMPMETGGFLPYLAFAAGLVAVLLQIMLRNAGILPGE